VLIFRRKTKADLSKVTYFRPKYEFVKKGIAKKMTKSTRKKAKRAKSSKKTKKMEKSTNKQSKAAGCVGHLLELHKLQGALLAQLYKEV
jgi:hypothetical protein